MSTTKPDNTAEAAKINWKTTVGGLLMISSKALQTNASAPVLWWIGEVCFYVGAGLLGTTAADAPVKK